MRRQLKAILSRNSLCTEPHGHLYPAQAQQAEQMRPELRITHKRNIVAHRRTRIGPAQLMRIAATFTGTSSCTTELNNPRRNGRIPAPSVVVPSG
jgi:hypothetical protein